MELKTSASGTYSTIDSTWPSVVQDLTNGSAYFTAGAASTEYSAYA